MAEQPDLWGAAAVVFPEIGKVFRFPISEAPAVPLQEIRDAFAREGFPVQSDHNIVTKMIPVLAELRDKSPEDVRHGRLPAQEQHKIVGCVMAVAAFSKERFWVVVGSNKVFTFQPVRPNSVAGGLKLIDEIIAEYSSAPSNRTLH